MRIAAGGEAGAELAFECGEESFGDGVVPAVSLSAHAERGAVPAQHFGVVVACIPHASVVMHDDAGGVTAESEGVAQGVGAERRFHGAGQSPPHDAPRVEVDDRGQVGPLSADLQAHVGDIAHPNGVGLEHAKIAFERVGRDALVVVRIRCRRHQSWPAPGPKSIAREQASKRATDGAETCLVPSLEQVVVHSRHARLAASAAGR